MKAFFVQMFLLVGLVSFAQEETKTQDVAYTKTINQRAEKIVAVLNLKDSIKAKQVQSLIAKQYRDLNDIHSERDAKVKAVKASGSTKEKTEADRKIIEETAVAKLKVLHEMYLAKLATHLNKEQVTQVKDGMTYNVVPITYKGYLDMIPTLTNEQKAQIMTWLVEAREYAMDAETSEKKHGWFGKYKGRINNYLSAAGYDLKKEGDAWQKRLKEKEEKNTTKN